MKPILGMVGGFLVSLGMFAGGVAVAIFMVVSEPPRVAEARADLLDLWSAQPRKVNADAQQFERLPALPVTLESKPAIAQDTAAVVSTDDVDPASAPGRAGSAEASPIGSLEDSRTEQLVAAHVEWCANRYRSYRADDNSYIGYSGEQRPCMSPYLEEIAAAESLGTGGDSGEVAIDSGEVEIQDAQLLFASDDRAQVGAHEIDCMNRYRSYRPEDNTYQPYGGGPRRQCR